jgi:hypothetical protein
MGAAEDKAYQDYQYAQYQKAHAAAKTDDSPLNERMQELTSPEEMKGKADDTKQFIQDHAKTAGMIAGGVAAGIPGAAIGSALGEGLSQGMKAASGADVTPESAAKAVGLAGLEGAGAEFTGSKIIGPSLEAVGGLLAKGVSHLPYVDAAASAIKTYAKRAQEVIGMSKSADGNVATAADQIRAQLLKDKQAFHNQLTSYTDDALEKRASQTININDATKALDDGLVRLSNKSGISDQAREAATKDLLGLKTDMQSMANEHGEISLLDANKFKQDLQDRAFEGEGHILNQDAARDAQAVLRQQINKAAPEVAAMNEQQAAVLNLTKRMNKALTTPGKTEASLLKAGSGENPRSVADLTELDQSLGTNVLGQAQNLTAMKSFAKPGPNLAGPSLGNTLMAPVIRGASGAGAVMSSAAPGALGLSVIHGRQGENDLKRTNP